MVKLFGVILLIAGSTGFSYCMCQDRKKKLFLLKEMRRLFFLMQDEIRYSGLPITEIIKGVADKIEEPFCKALHKVGENLTWEDGRNLRDIWEQEMRSMLVGLPLAAQQIELFIKFPDLLGMAEREGQADVLKGYLKEFDNWIVQFEQEEKSKNKVIMSMGMATGILLSVLLL